MHRGLGDHQLVTLMRHAFSTPLPLPLASPKPALAFAVLHATPRRRLVALRRLPSTLHPGPLAALRIAVHVPAVALAADHHQPATAPTAELPSFMGFGCWVRRVDEPPERIETKFDLRSSLCETRDLSTPLRVVDGYSRPAIVFQDCGAGLVLFDGRAEPTPLAARSKKTGRRGPCSRRKLARARDHADPHDRRQIGRRGYAEPWDRPSRELGDGSRLSPSRIRREVVVLAHELGHFLSSERASADEYAQCHEAEVQRDEICDAVPREGRAPSYIKALGVAVQARLDSKQIELILAEEQRAWDFGRELVVEFWPEAQEHYEAEEKEGLLGHRRRLGIEEP